jgi:FkbH-like protein
MGTPSEIFAELDERPSLSGYAAAARKLKTITSELPTFRVAILSNHTFDIGGVLAVECARRGLQAGLYSAGYDQYRQELLDPQGGMEQFGPDAVLISLHLENTSLSISSATCALTQNPLPIGEWIAQFRDLLSAYRKRSMTPIFVQNFIPPASDMDGLLAASGRSAVFDSVMEMNAALRQMASSLSGVFIVDAAKIACRNNLVEWCDRRLWFLAKAGINPKKFPLLASEIARCFAALRRPAAKCLLLDLDNTVWGGILGDVGPEGIHCANEEGYPGNAYAAFQHALLALRSRGVLLAVASKNDAALVEDAFRKRLDMPLRPEHITDWEVHWGPKSESLLRIASRLNIGVESIVFLDDNPAEIAFVRMVLPSVRAYQMPSRPEDFVAFLANLADFDQLQLSSEDMKRPELYELRKKQTEMALGATDLETFYRSLKTVLTPEKANRTNLDRIVQLIQKTNQFNLTTRRHDQAELVKRIDHGSELWAFRARDVHGDHGVIAVALLDFNAALCKIDTLVMSCRVIGRTLETAILHFLEERALSRRSTETSGEYLPTSKNDPCKDFYERHAYVCVDRDDHGTRWSKNLDTHLTQCPEWIGIENEVAPTCSKA